MFELYVDDAETAYKNKEEDRYLFNMEQARRTMQELIGCFSQDNVCGRNVIAIFRFIYGKLVRSQIRRKPDELDRWDLCICMRWIRKMR